MSSSLYRIQRDKYILYDFKRVRVVANEKELCVDLQPGVLKLDSLVRSLFALSRRSGRQFLWCGSDELLTCEADKGY